MKKNWIVLGGQLVILCQVKDQRQGRGEFLVQGGVAVEEEESRVKKDVREKQKERNHVKGNVRGGEKEGNNNYIKVKYVNNENE